MRQLHGNRFGHQNLQRSMTPPPRFFPPRLPLPLQASPAPHVSLTWPAVHTPRNIAPSPTAISGSYIGYEVDTTQEPWSYTNHPISISAAARSRSLYLLGKSGTGKTTLFLNLILQDMLRGIGLC